MRRRTASLHILVRAAGRLAESRNDDRQIVKKLIALLGRQGIENAIVDATGNRIGQLEMTLALFRQLDSIGASVLFRPPTLQQSLLQHAPDDIGKRAAVDAGPLDEAGLADALVLGNRQQNSILARRQIAAPDLGMKNISGALARAVKHMQR